MNERQDARHLFLRHAPEQAELVIVFGHSEPL
jgi:hypothetical protein